MIFTAILVNAGCVTAPENTLQKDDRSGKHLFILSGQSNMAGIEPGVSFTPTVTNALGAQTYLKELIRQFQSDLHRKDINVVIGRISDAGIIVSKMKWGKDLDVMEVYIPLADMTLPKPISTLHTKVDQSTFDTMIIRGSVLLDEIRLGPTLESVLPGTVPMSKN